MLLHAALHAALAAPRAARWPLPEPAIRLPPLQDLPLDMPALEYVEAVARANDPGITLEKCRQALGALGLTGTMALQKIGECDERLQGERAGREGDRRPLEAALTMNDSQMLAQASCLLTAEWILLQSVCML